MSSLTHTQVDVHALALVAEAAVARCPGRSVAALVRHRLQQASEADQERVRARALEMLRAQQSPPQALATPGYLEIPEAARALRTSARTLKRTLHTAPGRRALGWPRWVGRWLIPAAAVDPLQAGSFFANLPEREPWPRESLPAWVEVNA